jgi:hypothetical protein
MFIKRTCALLVITVASVTLIAAPAFAAPVPINPAGTWLGHGFWETCTFTLTDTVGVTSGTFTVANGSGCTAAGTSGAWTVSKHTIAFSDTGSGFGTVMIGHLAKKAISTQKNPGKVYVAGFVFEGTFWLTR